MDAGRGDTRRVALIYFRVFPCNFVKFFNPFARVRVCMYVYVRVCDPAKEAEHSGDAVAIAVPIS